MKILKGIIWNSLRFATSREYTWKYEAKISNRFGYSLKRTFRTFLIVWNYRIIKWYSYPCALRGLFFFLSNLDQCLKKDIMTKWISGKKNTAWKDLFTTVLEKTKLSLPTISQTELFDYDNMCGYVEAMHSDNLISFRHRLQSRQFAKPSANKYNVSLIWSVINQLLDTRTPHTSNPLYTL